MLFTDRLAKVQKENEFCFEKNAQVKKENAMQANRYFWVGFVVVSFAIVLQIKAVPCSGINQTTCLTYDAVVAINSKLDSPVAVTRSRIDLSSPQDDESLVTNENVAPANKTDTLSKKINLLAAALCTKKAQANKEVQ